MKVSFAAGLVALTATVSAAPADNLRRANDIGRPFRAPINPRQASGSLPPYPTPTVAPYPYGTGAPYQTGTGAPYQTGTGVPYQTGTSAPLPTGTGTAYCPVDGAVVCNGPSYFGLCNFGSVVWQRVSDGTACINGQIVGVGIYATPTPWPPVPSGSYTNTVY